MLTPSLSGKRRRVRHYTIKKSGCMLPNAHMNVKEHRISVTILQPNNVRALPSDAALVGHEAEHLLWMGNFEVASDTSFPCHGYPPHKTLSKFSFCCPCNCLKEPFIYKLWPIRASTTRGPISISNVRAACSVTTWIGNVQQLDMANAAQTSRLNINPIPSPYMAWIWGDPDASAT